MIVRLGLMDQDERYLSRIAAFFSAHPEDTMQLELCLFSSVEECNAYLSANGRLDTLLAAPELLPDPAALKKPTILAYLSEDKSMTAWAGCPAVCKYQKASAILRSIQGLAANIHNAGGSYDLGGGGRVVLFAGSAHGVFQPAAERPARAVFRRARRFHVGRALQLPGMAAYGRRRDQ